MKKSVAKAWVKALRSGKYKQGKGKLKDGDTYCCLGVLCSISPYKNNYTKIKDADNEPNYILPKAVQKWAGMSSSMGCIRNCDLTLVMFNDKQDKSFHEIADIIEREVENL